MIRIDVTQCGICFATTYLEVNGKQGAVDTRPLHAEHHEKAEARLRELERMVAELRIELDRVRLTAEQAGSAATAARDAVSTHSHYASDLY